MTEQIIFDDGTEMGAWLAATFKSYDLAMTMDRSGAKGRLHHFTYFMDSREEVLKAADILVTTDGLVYVSDWNAGLNVLQYEG